MNDREIKELEKALEQIWDVAIRFGLDPFPTHFEIVPATVMYEIGSYALPGRYSHWTFGKAYQRMKTMYDFGLSKIYEVVINTNPSYGFLLETNSLIQNKLVMAHVLGHTDFFKNNVYFSKTNRRMVETASTHAARMAEYEFKYGRKTVEKFLDAVLSIEEHIDPDFFIRREDEERVAKRRIPSRKVEGRYDDLLGPREINAEEEKPRGERLPEKDLVYYIMKNSPILEDWQRDVMAMIHEEMEYFVPQMQTKIMNEGWACLTADALLLTEKGFIRFDQLYEAGEKIGVAAGRKNQAFRIKEFHKERQAPTVRIRTRRGLTIEGARKHRVLLADGAWAYLEDLKLGDRVHIEKGANLWPTERQRIDHIRAEPDATLQAVAAVAGAPVWTVLRHLRGRRTSNGAQINAAIRVASHGPARGGGETLARSALRAPEVLDEDLAWLLGYFVGDGDRTKSGICLTCGDAECARELAEGIEKFFGLRAFMRWEATERGGRWRIVVYSRELWGFLAALGIDLSDEAPRKRVPDIILRSPKQVVSAFLRGCSDAAACVGPSGIELSSSSEELIRAVQIVLLNYGILSTQRPQRDGGAHLDITGRSAQLFLDEIGFKLAPKQEALRRYVESHRCFEKEDEADEIIAIEYGCADVYDITVGVAHAYVANGLLHHNSFWHARIMRELDLTDEESIEFAELHASVVSPHKGQLNPYYLGYKIFEDIERRWDNPTKEEQEEFGRRPGQGREKIFEVRELENDVSFLRNYLTEELCEELDLFVYELVDDEEWRVTEKRWERVRDQLVANMTNFGFPYIVVADGDYNRNRELYLLHRYEGAELDLNYARKVLEHVYTLWGRPVHLETVVDGEKIVMHYDGEEHDED